MSASLYDGELRNAVEKFLKNPKIPDYEKEPISFHYWAINHEIADQRDGGVMLNGTYLASVAKQVNQSYIAQLAREFVKLYESEEGQRKEKRREETEKRDRMHRPEKTFKEDLEKIDPDCDFPGQQPINLNSLYGKLTIPDSQYLVPYTYNEIHDVQKREYIIGDDKRNAGEIWKTLEESLGGRMREMLAKETVKHEMNALSDYVGPLEGIHTIIAKNLIIPEEITKMRLEKEAEELEEREKSKGDIVESIRRMKIPDPYDVKVCKILKKEGLKIGNETVVDMVTLSPACSEKRLTEELMDRAFDVLKKDGYRKEKINYFSYGYNYYGPGAARAEIHHIGNCNRLYIGELKFVEPIMACGKTRSEMSKACDIAWENFRNETRQIEKRELDGIEEAKIILEKHGLTFSKDGAPNIPCGYIKGMDSCAPASCNGGRYVSKEKLRDDDNGIHS